MLLSFAAPYWIVAMWALFATTVNLSLRWLKGRLWLALILGAIGGPLAYFAGYRFGAVTFLESTTALILLSLGWALWTPLLVLASGRYDGYAPARVQL